MHSRIVSKSPGRASFILQGIPLSFSGPLRRDNKDKLCRTKLSFSSIALIQTTPTHAHLSANSKTETPGLRSREGEGMAGVEPRLCALLGPNRLSSLTPDGGRQCRGMFVFRSSHVFTLNSFTNDSESSEWNGTCYFETETQEGKDIRTSDGGKVVRGGGRGQSHPENLDFPVPKLFYPPG